MTTPDLKIAVRGVYDLQRLRIAMGNRIVAQFKARLGQKAGMTEEQLEEEEKRILADLRSDYQKITDGVKGLPRLKSFKGTELISTFSELALIDQYVSMEDSEARQFKMISKMLESDPIYAKFLSSIKGIGPALAGILLTEIDFAKAKYPSSLWKYAGYDVNMEDNRGRCRRAEHLRPYEYKDKNGATQTRVGITFNPLLKTKLFMIATSFLKCGSPYAEVYYNYKNRYENHAIYGAHNDGNKDASDHWITSKKRRHMMAMRAMIKRFLVDLHINARTILGLPVSEEYSVAKLGIKHSQPPLKLAEGGNVG